MRKPFLQHGYTLIELVFYLSLVIAISVVIIHSLVVMMRTYATAQTYRQLQTNGDFIMDRVIREVREAYDFNSSTVYDTNPGTLALNSSDVGGTPHLLLFAVSSGALQLTDNGTTGSLSTSEVTVTSFIVRHITTVAGEGVKIELQLTARNGTDASYYSTILLRNQ